MSFRDENGILRDSLDLDDVVSDHPVAKQELDELRTHMRLVLNKWAEDADPSECWQLIRYARSLAEGRWQ